jgi:hypothetical protein
MPAAASGFSATHHDDAHHTPKDWMEKRLKTVALANKTAYFTFIRAEASGHGRIVRTLLWSFA